MSKISTKAWCYARRGPIGQVLKLQPIELPVGPADAVVKVLKAPLHRTDAAVINGSALGKVAKKGAAVPALLVGGSEGVGTVVRAGTGAKVKEGDLVWVAPVHGCWAEQVVVPNTSVHKINPAHTDLAVSASCLLAAHRLTANFARLQAGDAIVQNGGSSLTALAVAALARERKVPVFTAALPGARFKEAAARQKTFDAQTFEYTGAGRRAIAAALAKDKLTAKLFLNAVGGSNFNEFCKLLGHGGTAVNFGAQSGFSLNFAVGNLIYKDITLSSYYLPNDLAALSYDERQAQLDLVLAALTKAKLQYPTDAVAGLDKLPAKWDSLFIQGGGAKGVLLL